MRREETPQAASRRGRGSLQRLRSRSEGRAKERLDLRPQRAGRAGVGAAGGEGRALGAGRILRLDARAPGGEARRVEEAALVETLGHGADLRPREGKAVAAAPDVAGRRARTPA